MEGNKAQHHITAVCLSILCDKKHGTTFLKNNLLGYAADNFITHLQLLDKSSFSRSENRAIVDPLFKLFHDDFFIERWVNSVSDWRSTFIPGWLNDKNMAKCVRDWFADEDIEHYDFTSEQILQIQSTAKSNVQLFQPLTTFCKTRWLIPKGGGSEPDFYVWFLHVYLTLVSDFHFLWNLEFDTLFSPNQDLMSRVMSYYLLTALLRFEKSFAIR